MQQISSISEFLVQAGTDYRIVDMGRAFRVLESQTFLDIENAKTPAPYPRQQQMWLGLVFWNKSLSEQRYIWFLKLPLDEQGTLVSANRDHFLQTIVDALGVEFLENEEHELKDNPYTFTPTEQQMSDFNSFVRHLLELPPSQYYQDAKNYIARPDLNDWQMLSKQGLSDLASNLLKDANAKHIAEHFHQFPDEVKQPLCASLENYQLPKALEDFFITQMQSSHGSQSDKCLYLRAITKSRLELSVQTIDVLLASDAELSTDLLVIIAGRHWQTLNDANRALRFFECCSKQNLFLPLYGDLVQIPEIRHSILGVIRNPNRSETLAKQIQTLFH